VPAPYAGSHRPRVERSKGDLQFVNGIRANLKPTDISGLSRKRISATHRFKRPVSGGTYRQLRLSRLDRLFVHPDNPISQLTFDQIDALYSPRHHRGWRGHHDSGVSSA